MKYNNELPNSFQISIYTTSLALRGIPDISFVKPTTTAMKSVPAKHQISASNSCFLQLLSYSPPATAAFEKQKPKQTDP
jgi:hypothetical protein